MEYPKGSSENLNYRINIIERAEKDPVLQALLVEECRKDPLFFVNSFVFTYDPRLTQAVIPFITYPFQDDYINDIIGCIESGKDNITEKSRDMGVSWQICAIAVWSFLFKGWSGLFGSYKQDYVDSSGNMDSLFEKMRFILDYLPAWMKPADLNSYYMTINSVSLGSEIAGDAGDNFGTGGRRKYVFMDEFPLWGSAEKAFRKTRDITNCRIFAGTPEGRYNIYGKIMTGHPDYAHLNIKKFRLHWTLHPKKTREWYEEEKKKRTKIEIAKELDISYDDSVTGAVYKDFGQLTKVGKYNYNPQLPTYTSWDFGLDTNALLFRQKDHKNNAVYMIRAIKRKDWNIKKMYAFVLGTPTPGFTYTDDELNIMEETQHYRYTTHFGDPYNGDSRSTVTNDTIKSTLAEVGIYLQLNRGSTIEERIRKTTLSLDRLYINETEIDFIHDMTQSRYPEVKENSQRTAENQKPIHNECSHIRTAAEYRFDNEPTINRPNPFQSNKIVYNKLTGQPMNARPSGVMGATQDLGTINLGGMFANQ